MMKINRYARSRFKNLKTILKTWVKLNKQYFVQSGDAPWWYNERAGISILSAATWVAGGIALEEFSAQKGRGRSKHSGRCDLYTKLGCSEFAFEAKTELISLNVKPQKNLAYIEGKLRVAREDAKSLQPNEGKPFGVCFVMVLLPKKSVSDFEKEIVELQEEIVSADFDAIAWSFPSEARKLCDASSWPRHYFPGSILVMREA